MNGTCDMHKICKILFFADQQHLSNYGRSITNDTYIAMQYGPVPSNVDDIFKAVRGDSFFSNDVDQFKRLFRFDNRYIVRAIAEPDTDYLSATDLECLDAAIEKCRNLSFEQLTNLSHGLAWGNTARDRAISVKDMLRECGDQEDYVDFISEKLQDEYKFAK
jgi:uncharacterized phage-associated protein